MRFSGVASIYAFIRSLNTSTVPTAGEGLLGVSLEDKSGRPAMMGDGDTGYVTPTGLPIGGYNDGNFRIARFDRSGGIASANLAPLLTEPFDGTTLNGLRWTSSNVNYVPTVTPVGYNFNPTSSLAASSSAILTTSNKFLKTQRNPFYNKWRVRYNKVSGAQAEFGLGVPVTNILPVTGAFWRLVGNQAFGVITINSTEYISPNPIDISTFVDVNNHYTYDIFIDDDEASFTIHDTFSNLILRTTVRLQNVQARLFNISRLPLFGRLFVGAVAPTTAPNLFISDVYLGMVDTDNNRFYDDFLSANAMAAYSNILTGVQALQYTNNAEPGNAVLSNTAAGYATLGGKYQFAAPAGATTDYLLFAVQVPDPTSIKIKSVRITAKSVGAAVTTSATELEWFLVTNMASASLVAAGGIRIPLGLQTFLISAVVVSPASDVVVDFTSMPVRCDAGRFIGIGVRVPGGTATAAQIIKGAVIPIGTFE